MTVKKVSQYRSNFDGFQPAYAVEPLDAIIFSVQGEPMSKQRPRFNPKSGRAFTPKQTRDAEREIADAFQATGHQMFDSQVGIELKFFMGTRRRKDVDNLVKTCLDALNGLAFTDDHLVHVLSAVKFFSTPDRARTEIRIFRTTEMVER